MSRRLFFLVCCLAACGPAGDALPGNRESAPSAAASPASAGDTTRAVRPRVVFLGTSLTAGLGLLRAEDTYVARVAALADSAGRPIEAVNAGVSGETSAGGLRRVDWILEDPVDVLVLELGANDGLRGQDPAAMERNLSSIIDQVRARYPGTPVVVAGMEAPPNLGSGYTERFRRVFRDVADRHDAVLVPFLLDGVAGDRDLNQADGIHPNPDGHRIMARTLWPHLQHALDEFDAMERAAQIGGDGR